MADDPEMVIERMERLVEETSARAGETQPLDELGPIARKHRAAICRGAAHDDE